MPNTFYPTQIGYRPTGVNGVVGTSSLYFGRIVSGEAPYDGPGFGAGGRPDYLDTLVINLATSQSTDGQWGTITMNVEDIVNLYQSRAEFPANLNLTLKEVLVCEDGVAKGMVILGSQTYPTGAA